MRHLVSTVAVVVSLSAGVAVAEMLVTLGGGRHGALRV